MEDDLASKQRKFSALSFQSNFDLFIIQCTPFLGTSILGSIFIFIIYISN